MQPPVKSMTKIRKSDKSFKTKQMSSKQIFEIFKQKLSPNGLFMLNLKSFAGRVNLKTPSFFCAL